MESTTQGLGDPDGHKEPGPSVAPRRTWAERRGPFSRLFATRPLHPHSPAVLSAWGPAHGTNQGTLSQAVQGAPGAPRWVPPRVPQSRGRLHPSPLCDPPCNGGSLHGVAGRGWKRSRRHSPQGPRGTCAPTPQNAATPPRPRPFLPEAPPPRADPPPGPPLPPADPPLSGHAARAPVPRRARPAAEPLPGGAAPGLLPAAPGAPGPAAGAARGPGGLPRAGGPVPGVRALGRAATPRRPVLPPGGLPREPGSGLPGWEGEGRTLGPPGPRTPRSPAPQDPPPTPRRCPA